MPTASPNPVPIPPPSVQAIDPQTGLVTKAWYDFWSNQASILSTVRKEIP